MPLFTNCFLICLVLIRSVWSAGSFTNPAGSDGYISYSSDDSVNITWTGVDDYTILSLGIRSSSNATISWFISNSQADPPLTSYPWIVNVEHLGFDLQTNRLFQLLIVNGTNFGQPFESSYFVVDDDDDDSDSSTSTSTSSATDAASTSLSISPTSAITTTARTSGAQTTASTFAFPSSSPVSSSTSPSNHGLSTGAKAGIGVGVAVGVIAIAGIAFFIFTTWRRRSQRGKNVVSTSHTPLDPTHRTDQDGEITPAPSKYGVTNYYGKGSSDSSTKMPAHQERFIHEAPSGSGVAQLPGDPGSSSSARAELA